MTREGKKDKTVYLALWLLNNGNLIELWENNAYTQFKLIFENIFAKYLLYSNSLQHIKHYVIVKYVIFPLPHSNVITFQKFSLLDESTETEEDFACVTT